MLDSEGGNSLFISAKSSACVRYLQFFTSGKIPNCDCTLLISPGVALGCIQMLTRVPCCHVRDACAALCFSRSADPTSESDTATVKTAAIVIIRLRQRLEKVSLTA